MKIEYIPIKRTELGTSILHGNEKEKILEEFYFRSKEITSENFVKENYDKFAESKLREYISVCAGNNLIIKVLKKLKMNGIIKRIYSKNKLLNLLNIIECEAHRELFIVGLKNEISKD